MITILLQLGLFVLPVVSAGVLVGMALKRLRLLGGASRVRGVLVVTATLATLCAVTLALTGGHTELTFMWLPDTEPMMLSMGASSLLAATATAAALVVTAVVAESPSPLTGGAALLALAAGNVAFLAGHFLLRYVALEVVGLVIAAAPLIEARDRRSGAQAAWIYLILRLGDAGLLTAILVLWSHTGTLEIGPALEAAKVSPGGIQAWAAAGFLLAVAVKMGLWPFHAWIQGGSGQDRLVGTWLYATLMPNLGLYLLYRVGPLVRARPGTRWVALGVGILIGAATLLTTLQRSRRVVQPARIMAGVGAALWCAVVGIHYRIAWWGLLALSLARLPLFLRRTVRQMPAPRIALDDSMRHVARRLQADVQEGLLQRGLGTLAGGLNRIADWLHDHVERDVLERGLTEGAEKTLTGAQRLHAKVEEGGLEGGLRGLVRATLHASHHLRLWHGGKLRVNLGWVVLSLAVALFIALIV